MALFGENGPCSVTKDGLNTTLNKYSWNSNANLLYIDQPTGTPPHSIRIAASPTTFTTTITTITTTATTTTTATATATATVTTTAATATATATATFTVTAAATTTATS